ncbi:MAG TPA: energy transducer TonB [Terriglobales bacterium]|nr:energy transducer TonB [Terriglobales bacterium]
MAMLEGETQAQLTTQTVEPAAEPRQRRQMLIALAILLMALAWVAIKDRAFWSSFLFPASNPVEVESDDASLGQPGSGSLTYRAPKTSSPRPKPRVSAPPAETAAAAPPVVNRAVLPPLEIEVVAGDQRRAVHPGNPAVHVDLQPQTGVGATSNDLTSASERTSLSPGTKAVVTHTVEPNYPLLAKQMKVQGSVLLQALIGRDGNIQDLHVLSGPAILSEAARQAVKQWRFKPYLQGGEAVETEARITVNFTISAF